MIYHNGNPWDFAAHIDVVIHTGNIHLGSFNFIIDEVLLPGRYINLTLPSIVSELKYQFDHVKQKIQDIGEKNISADIINHGEELNIIYLGSNTELCDKNCIFCLGYSGDTERFFYSTDLGKTFKEKRLPRGTVEAVIRLLPNDGNPLIIAHPASVSDDGMVSTNRVIYSNTDKGRNSPK